MAEAKIYIPDGLDRKLREYAMRRFGYGRGSISMAAAEAITMWLSRIALIENRLALIAERSGKDKEIVAVLLFGSYARKEPGFRDVDVSLLIEEGANPFDLIYKYKNLAGVESDIDVSVLQEMPLSMQARIIKESIVLYSRDRSRIYDYTAGIIEKWGEFEYNYGVALG